ncbi:MAG: hypothetical protein LBR26_09455 [Prevotella sp.]|jgi:hypothetical protein|nr:hypothetical protein [Prevotella sp.]
MMVRNALDYPSLSLGALCSCNKINKWAKYKPVRNNFTSERPSNWWKATGGRCGLDIPSYTTIEAMMTAVKNGIDYTYQQPRGGTSEPYRLGDFAGYDPLAMPPVEAFAMGGTYYKTSDTIQIGCMATDPAPDGWLSKSDIYVGWSTIYFGAAIRTKGASTANYITGATQLDDSGILDYPTSGLSVGVCEVYRFVCQNAKPSISTPGIANTFIPIPGSYSEFNLEAAGVTVTVNADYNNSRITGNIYVYNRLTSSVTVSQIQLTFRYATSNANDPLLSGERRVDISNITCSAGGDATATIPTQTSILPDYPTQGGYVMIACYITGQGYYTGSTPLMSST